LIVKLKSKKLRKIGIIKKMSEEERRKNYGKNIASLAIFAMISFLLATSAGIVFIAKPRRCNSE
jgi:hypothetical protein